MGRRLVAMGAVLAFAVAMFGQPVLAASDSLGGAEPQSTSSKLGWGMASVGTNLGYMPAKMLYALGGGLVGLLAWGFTAGDDNVLHGILDPSFGGTWAVTPENLRDGDNHPIMFSGPSYDPRS
ncbi:MAG TPA: hypothetical protein VL049_30685 [Candidatus Dormibacteraeota bacterium]|nr:hypothetical protein [Candidatus Dormibacteraeota bacterium]